MRQHQMDLAMSRGVGGGKRYTAGDEIGGDQETHTGEASEEGGAAVVDPSEVSAPLFGQHAEGDKVVPAANEAPKLSGQNCSSTLEGVQRAKQRAYGAAGGGNVVGTLDEEVIASAAAAAVVGLIPPGMEEERFSSTTTMPRAAAGSSREEVSILSASSGPLPSQQVSLPKARQQEVLGATRQTRYGKKQAGVNNNKANISKAGKSSSSSGSNGSSSNSSKLVQKGKQKEEKSSGRGRGKGLRGQSHKRGRQDVCDNEVGFFWLLVHCVCVCLLLESSFPHCLLCDDR